MKTIEAFEENFLFDDSKKYHLSLQIGPGTLSYAILNIDDKKYQALKHINFKNNTEKIFSELLLTEFENDTCLKHNFASVAFQYQSFRSMLVPESLFDQKNLKAFLKFHHDIDDKDDIRFIDIKPAEAYIIFSIPNYIEKIVGTRFSGIKYLHHCVPFISKALPQALNEKEVTALHINFAPDFFDVLIVRNNKILLFNSFFYKKYTDVVYFVANILNLFSLKPDKTGLYITGEMGEELEVKTELSKIFKNILFEKFSLDFTYAPSFSDLLQYQFVNLLNLYSCVS